MSVHASEGTIGELRRELEEERREREQALAAVAIALECQAATDRELLEAFKDANRRTLELSEDLAGLANQLARLAHAAASKAEVRAELAEITARIDSVHKQALRALTHRIEGSKAP